MGRQHGHAEFTAFLARAFAALAIFILLPLHPATGGVCPGPSPRLGPLLFAEEFDTPLDFTTQRQAGKWRANDFWQDPLTGYVDFGGSSWNVNPNEHPSYSPFEVANGVLKISAFRTPADLARDLASRGIVPSPKWSGGILITDKDRFSFLYGRVEVRARLVGTGRGMFPAIWLYVADGRRRAEKSGAEIDLFEVSGHADGRPWEATLHLRDYLGNGREIRLLSSTLDPEEWRSYSIDWSPCRITLLLDGQPAGSIEGEDAAWFNVPMGIRLNYAMDGDMFPPWRRSSASTPDHLSMEVDFVRVWGAGSR
ncbi:Glycosyl hydrolases family 16 [Azospirillum oryzae]|uniref:Glycosyl hydrolases family 16 n=1 Tax=Azospirillum oryzae TaxID=286727 RepID=A0A1X7F2B0_9PROT|nr:glycoside hydrolase family 16 protein [Azospirillum oryzae]SMF43953.1 Glycosyl hydrolases family 16 [Azospirillum oryzae]